jgi:ABC-type uncharacterized transport system permease subunit
MRRALIPIAAVLVALLAGSILIAAAGVSPTTAYLQLLRGASGINLDWSWGDSWSDLIAQPSRLGNSLTEATPLILAALAVAVPFAGGVFNIGAEGQLLMGGLGATLVGLADTGLPPALHELLALLGGFVFGAFWAAIPGWLRAYRHLNEIITAIMLNFLAFWLISYLVHGPMKDAQGFGYPWSPEIPATLHLPKIWAEARMNLGIVIAVGSALCTWLLLSRSVAGYELRAVGTNPVAARFAGMPVERLMCAGMIGAGGLAGLAGACVILGVQFRLSDSFSPGYGYDAIAVMFIGQGNPLGILIAGIFFGAFRTGAEAMELSASVPKSLATVVQAVALLFVILCQSRRLADWWAKQSTFRRRTPHGSVSDSSIR